MFPTRERCLPLFSKKDGCAVLYNLKGGIANSIFQMRKTVVPENCVICWANMLLLVEPEFPPRWFKFPAFLFPPCICI